MCGISGFFHPEQDFAKKESYCQDILDSMNLALKHRGPRQQGTCVFNCFGLAQVCSDPPASDSGSLPLKETINGSSIAVLWDGELYNAPELKKELESLGHTFEGPEDTRIILAAYLEYGPDFVKKLNGVFAIAIAIADCAQKRLLLYRDRSGIKPLFYSIREGTVVFSSELKGLFAWPGLKPELTLEGLNEIFSLGPAKTSGSGVFKGILEVLPGHFLSCSLSGIRVCSYWELKSLPHEDSYSETIEKTSWLLEDAVCRQMKPDSPVCAFLSGGVDSSLVSAICARELKKKNKQLTTFSFDFTGNDKNFKANSFQPSLDKPYVEKMVDYLDSDHHFLECSAKDQFDLLEASVLAHDLPAMADVDSSLIYFCSQVAPLSPAALTGECADEIFGGYPWFHREECFQASTFPWTMDLKARQVLLSDDFLSELKMEEYVKNRYEASLAQVPALPGESPTEARRREISYLNLRWFMQTLLDRMDRASMHSGLKARVPFADYRIIEYLWNVPWEMKARDGIVKNLLRQAGRGQLPDEVLFRKKSPYPKTYDTAYEALLSARVREILEDSSSPVLPFIDKKKVLAFLASPSDYGKPWYGQLMAAPQMMAYLIQIDFWLRQYRPKLPDFR